MRTQEWRSFKASERGTSNPIDPGVTIGHVHLKVADLERALAFYCDVLGFELTARLPQAAFISAGGYHHHLGLNTWGTRGAPPPPPGARGLVRYRVVVPTADDLRVVAERLDAAGVAAERRDGGLEVVDPSGNRALVEADRD